MTPRPLWSVRPKTRIERYCWRDGTHRTARTGHRPRDRADHLRPEAAARSGQAARQRDARVQGGDHRQERRGRRGRRAAAAADRRRRGLPGGLRGAARGEGPAELVGPVMASAALRRPVRHEDRLSLVEHLDELRSRLIVAFVALVAAFSVCFAFNGTLLDVVNRPLEHETQKNVDKGRGPLGQIKKVEDGVRGFSERLDTTLALLARPDSGLPRATRALLVRQRAALQAQRAQLPKITGNRPVTLGIGEPFTNTLIVSLYFAILLAMPFLLWQGYAFVLPAFSPEERRIALPLMMMIPGLFLIGVAFGYFLVLPAAVLFLQNFNADDFTILIPGH